MRAALETQLHGVQHRSRIQLLIDNILPGLPDPNPHLSPSVQLDRAVEANVRWTMRQMLETPEAQARLAEGRVKLVGAVYESVFDAEDQVMAPREDRQGLGQSRRRAEPERDAGTGR